MVAGSLVVPAAVSILGLEAALWVPSGFLVVVALVAIGGLRRAEATAQAVQADVAPRVQLRQGLLIFDGASSAVLERIAREMKESASLREGCRANEGEAADDFFVVAEGDLRMSPT
jgi:hypothetical protein